MAEVAGRSRGARYHVLLGSVPMCCNLAGSASCADLEVGSVEVAPGAVAAVGVAGDDEVYPRRFEYTSWLLDPSL